MDGQCGEPHAGSEKLMSGIGDQGLRPEGVDAQPVDEPDDDDTDGEEAEKN